MAITSVLVHPSPNATAKPARKSPANPALVPVSSITGAGSLGALGGAMSTNSAPLLRRFSPRTSISMSNRRTPPLRLQSSLDRSSPLLCRRRVIGFRVSGPGSLQWLRRLRRRRTSGRRTAGTPATTPASAAGANSSVSSRHALSLALSRRRVRPPLSLCRQLLWSQSPRRETSDSQAALSKAFRRCLRL
jgi:hypothetical protein